MSTYLNVPGQLHVQDTLSVYLTIGVIFYPVYSYTWSLAPNKAELLLNIPQGHTSL